MKRNLIKKIDLSPKNVAVSAITSATSTLLNRTVLKDVNPMIKYGSGILLGTGLSYFSKNKVVKQAGIGLILSNSENWIYDTTQKTDCPFKFEKHLPLPNTSLININSGRIIQENQVEEGFIYLTDKNDISGWSNCFKLKHCLNISGKSGGLFSKKRSFGSVVGIAKSHKRV